MPECVAIVAGWGVASLVFHIVEIISVEDFCRVAEDARAICLLDKRGYVLLEVCVRAEPGIQNVASIRAGGCALPLLTALCDCVTVGCSWDRPHFR